MKTKCLKYVVKKIFPNKHAGFLFSVQKNTKNIDAKIMKTKNGRFALSSKCAICGITIMKEQEAK